MSAIDKGPTH